MLLFIFFTLILGVLERVGVPRFLLIPYVVAVASSAKDIGVKTTSSLFFAGIMVDLIWRSRFGVSSILLLLCLALFDRLKSRYGVKISAVSGLVSVLVSMVLFMFGKTPIVWWHLVLSFVLTIIFYEFLSRDNSVRGEVFLRRS